MYCLTYIALEKNGIHAKKMKKDVVDLTSKEANHSTYVLLASAFQLFHTRIAWFDMFYLGEFLCTE